MSYYYGLLEQLTTGTDSSLIFFFIIVCIVVIGAVFPMYKILLKDRKSSRELEKKKEAERLKHEEKKEAERLKYESERHTKYIERERELINVMREISVVIAENTAVIGTHKSILLDNTGKIFQAVERIHDRIDVSAADSAETKMMLKIILNNLRGEAV